MGVLRRNEEWLNKKNQKIKEARLKKWDNELNGCTFEPSLIPYRARTIT